MRFYITFVTLSKLPFASFALAIEFGEPRTTTLPFSATVSSASANVPVSNFIERFCANAEKPKRPLKKRLKPAKKPVRT